MDDAESKAVAASVNGLMDVVAKTSEEHTAAVVKLVEGQGKLAVSMARLEERSVHRASQHEELVASVSGVDARVNEVHSRVSKHATRITSLETADKARGRMAVLLISVGGVVVTGVAALVGYFKGGGN